MNLDPSALRLWGVAASAASLAVALAFAWRAPAPASAEQRLEIAQTRSAHVAFIVRFRGGGPIARAQALAGAGEEARAARQVETQLRRQSALSGLCFDRFTIGGAEIVLRSCEPVPASGRQAYVARWLARLDAMRAVDYVDANVEASPLAAPG